MNVSMRLSALEKEIVELKKINSSLRKLVALNELDESEKSKSDYIYIKKALKLKEIIELKYGVDIGEKTRKREVVQARQLFCYWLCYNTNLTLYTIGQYTGLYHHYSTIIHARDTFADLLRFNKYLRQEYDDICKSMDTIQDNENEPIINPS